MKRFLPLFLLLVAFVISSCKSSTETVTQTHGNDADGNVWMKAPPPGEGIQIEVQPFTVPTGTEVQGNFYFNIPSNVPFDVGRIEIAMNEGTHHMNLYKTAFVWPPDSGVPAPVVFSHIDGKVDTVMVRYEAQFNATNVRTNGGDLMVEAQVPYLNWEFPKLTEGTSVGAQTCIHFDANQTLVIENHYVNSGTVNQTTPNGKGKVIINLWKPTGTSLVHAAMMFAKKTAFKLPPMTDTTLTKDCIWLNNPQYKTAPLYILGMTGHFHSRGKNFWVDKMQQKYDASGNVSGDSVLSTIYRSATWSEPPFSVYDTPIKLDLSKGEFLKYHAEYYNPLTTTINFGPHVLTEEHMNLFVWFVPGILDGRTMYDDSN